MGHIYIMIGGGFDQRNGDRVLRVWTRKFIGAEYVSRSGAPMSREAPFKEEGVGW